MSNSQVKLSGYAEIDAARIYQSYKQKAAGEGAHLDDLCQELLLAVTE